MSNLKVLRTRIKSVKSTQKITQAMKMLAAARLKKAQNLVESSREYALAMRQILENMLANARDFDEPSVLLTGRQDVKAHLIIVVTSDRGLCGGFNSTICRETVNLIKDYERVGIPYRIMCIGRKGKAFMRRIYKDLVIAEIDDWGKKTPDMEMAITIAKRLRHLLEEGRVGKIKVVYSIFKSALTQQVTHQKLVPAQSHDLLDQEQGVTAKTKTREDHALYDYEPNQQHLLNELLPRNLAVQIYQILLETSASEHGARMTAMDNATRNAKDVIDRLELSYNRSRQATITNELIEIISGAEAL